jgi:hypothetical protein
MSDFLMLALVAAAFAVAAITRRPAADAETER